MAFLNTYLKALIFGSIFVNACAQESQNDGQNKTVKFETEYVQERIEFLITANCNDFPSNSPCINTIIPNYCKGGYEEIDFCREWPDARIENGQTQYSDGQNLYSKGAQLDFELPISHINYSGTANVIFKDMWPSPCGMDALIGFLGYTQDGFPIINSDKGPVELQLEYIPVGYENARIVIDSKSRKIIAQYMAPSDFERGWSFSFESNGQAYLQTDGKCFKLPMNNRAKLSTANDLKCNPKIDSWNRDKGTKPADALEKELAYDILQELDNPFLEFIDIKTYDLSLIHI